jgi:NAD(P)-dependent dehydrogenase (short-subunit alcohol dehydrogenase family)
MRLNGKVALVTGAARGIGEAIARSFHHEGARVVLTDIDDEQGARLAGELGPNASYHRLDVREENDWSEVMAKTVGQHGRVDIVVNNAGTSGFDDASGAQDPEHVVLADWRHVMRTNLEGVMLGCKHAIRAMRKEGNGSIINMGSRSGVVGVPAAAPYAASKAGVRNHTKSVALYCAEQGLRIRCNVIQPAAILTPMWEPMLGQGPDREARMAALVAETPLRRFGTPEEVAWLAVYLASEESAYMTGAELDVDGGILAGSAASPRKTDAAPNPD